MIILTGKSCSGKDTILKELTKLGYQKIITYTTRPPRKKEIDGLSYNFITEKDFLEKITNNFFAEYDAFHSVEGEWFYGSSKDSYFNSQDKAIILTPKGISQIKVSGFTNFKVFYIDAPEEIIKERLEKRGDKKEEAERRMLKDDMDFIGISQITDYTILNDGKYSPEFLAKIINMGYKGGE